MRMREISEVPEVGYHRFYKRDTGYFDYQIDLSGIDMNVCVEAGVVYSV
jgi:hypothetical protein